MHTCISEIHVDMLCGWLHITVHVYMYLCDLYECVSLYKCVYPYVYMLYAFMCEFMWKV